MEVEEEEDNFSYTMEAKDPNETLLGHLEKNSVDSILLKMQGLVIPNADCGTLGPSSAAALANSLESLNQTPEEMKRMSSVVAVSNRLPFVLSRDKADRTFLTRKASAGGLVTAVAPVVIKTKGIWVGWTGLHDFTSDDIIPESNPEDTSPTAAFKSNQAAPVIIPKQMFEDYYNGACNATLWPLFHSFPDKAVFDANHWKAYREVNKLFAHKSMEVIRKLHKKRKEFLECYRPDPPVVWVHDYQLLLAAATIRQLCIEENIPVKMGYFLHIPFPSYDILRICPWEQEIVQGLLGNDMVAFHTNDYKLNFIDCARRNGLWTDQESCELVSFQSRLVLAKELPIGIPYDQFDEMSKKAPKNLPTDIKVILGIDRLDYTKGIKERLTAIETLFCNYPEWKEKVVFIQVAVPSRTDVKEYIDLKETIERMVGRINGLYSKPHWSPIRYIYGSVDHDQLAGYYRDAHVALVTPLRDGMNLVAKEFVACQGMNDPGVLVLSPFAGAGAFMHEALSVNPYETEKVAEEINRALKMPLVERIMRMKPMKIREKRNDVNSWVKNFMDSLNQAITINIELSANGEFRQRPSRSYVGVDFELILGNLLADRFKLGLILDFDGTLSHLAPTPEQAFMSPEIKKSLERLSMNPDVSIVIVSSRTLEDLEKKVGLENVTYAANHGVVIKYKDGMILRQEVPDEYEKSLGALYQELKENVEENGAWVEDKKLLVAWHYRAIDKSVKEEMISKAMEIYKKHGFLVLQTSKRLENHPPEEFDRGASCMVIIRTLFGTDWKDRVKIVYAGDSDSDEIAITRLTGMATRFRVTNEDSTPITKTDADFWLCGLDGVLKMTKFVEKTMMGRDPSSLSSSLNSIPGAIERSDNKGSSSSKKLSDIIQWEKLTALTRQAKTRVFEKNIQSMYCVICAVKNTISSSHPYCYCVYCTHCLAAKVRSCR